MTALETLVDGLDFGEGPRWHDGRLWYSDFFQGGVFAVSTDGTRERICAVPGQPSGLGWLPDGRMLVVSMRDERIYRLEHGKLELHCSVSHLATHCNDMVVAADGRATTFERQQCGQDPDGRGLARAVRAEQPDQLALGHLEVDAGERGEVTKALDEPLGDHSRHALQHTGASIAITIFHERAGKPGGGPRPRA